MIQNISKIPINLSQMIFFSTFYEKTSKLGSKFSLSKGIEISVFLKYLYTIPKGNYEKLCSPTILMLDSSLTIPLTHHCILKYNL